MKNQSKRYSIQFLEKEKSLIIITFLLILTFIILPFIVHKENPSIAFQLIIRGIIRGAFYSILALGFSLIYGIAKQLKLSAGGYYILAAYSMYFLIQTTQIRTDNINNIPIGLDINGVLIFILLLLPVVLILASIIYLYNKLNLVELISFILAPIVASGSVLYFGGLNFLIEAFFVALAVTALGFSAWFLEFPKNYVSFGTLFIGLLIPIFILLGLPTVHVSLMIISALFTAFVAMLSDRFLLDKFRHSQINTLIITFSLALLIQSLLQMAFFPTNGGEDFVPFGTVDRTLRPIMSTTDKINIFGTSLVVIRLLFLVFSILAIILLYLFIWKTKMGTAMRAVSQDEDAAALVGINIRKVTAIVSGIGMGLIGLVAVLTSADSWALPTVKWSPAMGWAVLIITIAIVTLGGIGSLPGSVIAAFIFAYTETFVSFCTATKCQGIDSSFSVVLPFIMVFIIMLFKPEGFLGTKEELE